VSRSGLYAPECVGGEFSEVLVDVLSCHIALYLPRDRNEVDRNQARWWVAFNLDPSARPPQPQGVLSAGWSEISPIFAPTAEEAEALCVFTTDYGATSYMQSLGAKQGGSHPIITEGLNSRQDLEQIAEQFNIRYVAVNPSLAEEDAVIVPLSEFLDRLP
jgi:hypothetical protein